MMRTFNMGIGMLLVVPFKKFKKAQTLSDRAGERAHTIGHIVKGERKVTYSWRSRNLLMKRLGILLSGRGSNFEAIANNIENGSLEAEIAIVISNVPEAGGLQVARERGLKTLLIPSAGKKREAHEAEVIAALQSAKV